MTEQTHDLVEVKVYMSPALYALLQAELALCGCAAASLCRNAIAKELSLRARARHEQIGQRDESHVASRGQ